MRLDEVPAVLTAARFLWLSDRNVAPKGDQEADLCRTWHRHLAPFSVDEATAALDSLLATNPTYCPSLGVIVSEVRQHRHRTQLSAPSPLLEPPTPPTRTADPCAEMRDRNRRELVRFRRDAKGHISQENRAEIEAEVTAVGPNEQRATRYIAEHPGADFGRVTRELVESWSASPQRQQRDEVGV